MELKELIKEYENFEKKYKLPKFDRLNEDFEIGKIDHNNGLIVKTIRKVMMEKVINSLSFIEMLLNPVNAPKMYMQFIRAIDIKDKKNLDKIYNTLIVLSMASLEREMNYDEKAEASLIIDVEKRWNEVKPNFRELFAKMKNPVQVQVKKERSYFG